MTWSRMYYTSGSYMISCLLHIITAVVPWPGGAGGGRRGAEVPSTEGGRVTPAVGNGLRRAAALQHHAATIQL